MANNMKGYDAAQVMRSIYDVTKNTLRVSIVDGSSGGGSFEVIISHTDDSIRLGDGTNLITSTSTGGKVGLDINLINLTLPLPTGAATAAKQDALLAELQLKADLTETQPVSAASLPLPSGASTSALQTSGNASLASIDTKLTSPLAVTGPLTDTQLRASAVPVSLSALPTLPAGTNVIGHVIVDTAPSTPVTNVGTFPVQATLAAETTKVIGTVNQGTTPWLVDAQTLLLNMDTTTTANMTYVGRAVIGSATSAAVWQIKCIDETSGLAIKWASGLGTFSQVWDNRASLTYS